MNPIQDAQYARDRYDEILRNAEQSRLIHALQPKRPSLVAQLKSHLAGWAELARPQRNRAKRA